MKKHFVALALLLLAWPAALAAPRTVRMTGLSDAALAVKGCTPSTSIVLFQFDDGDEWYCGPGSLYLKKTSVGGTVADLADVTNVTLTTPADGAVLCFTGATNDSVDCTVGGDATATEDAGVLTLAIVNDSHDHTTTTISGLVVADLTDVNAGTNLTGDLEEEGQVNATTVTGNATGAGQLLFATGIGTASWDGTPAIDCTDCTNIPAAADLADIGNVTLTTPADGGVLCFTGATNSSVDCTVGGDATATEDAGVLTLAVVNDSHAHTGSTLSAIPVADLSDVNAGSDLTADLEEEGQVNATAVTGNAASSSVLFGTGASAASWDTTPAIDCTDCTNIPAAADLADIGNVTLTTPGDGGVLCFTGTGNASIDCTVGGDATATEDAGVLTLAIANDSHDHTTTTISGLVVADLTDVNAGTDLTADLEEESHCSEHDSPDLDCSGEQLVIAPGAIVFADIFYNHTLASNPSMTADECFFLATTAGGGFVCEGNTADTIETFYSFPDINSEGTIPIVTGADVGVSSASSGAVLFGTGSAAASWDTTPAIDCTDCTNIPAAADLADIGNVTLTTPGDGGVLCFTGTGNASIDCTVGGDATATEDAGVLTLAIANDSHDHTGSTLSAIPVADLSDVNAGSDLTADLEEEGQVNATAVTGNAASSSVLFGTGASAASWDATPAIDCTDCTNIPAAADLADIGNVTLTTPADGGLLCFTGTGNASVDCAVGGDLTGVESGGNLVFAVTNDSHSHTGSTLSAIPVADLSDVNAGSDLTADLEEEGQVNATAVTGNAASSSVLFGTGASAASWDATPAIDCTDCTNIPAAAALNDIGDVTLTTPADGGVLCFTGTGNASIDCGLAGDVSALESGGFLTVTVINDSHNHGASTVTDVDADAVIGDTIDDNDLDVGAGGTGVSTLTDGGVLLGSGGADITATARPTAGQLVIGATAGDPVLAAPTGDANEIDVQATSGALAIGLPAAVIFPGSAAIDNGSAPTVNAAGEIAIDTTSDQFVYFGTAKRVLHHKKTYCGVLEDLAATDDNFELYMMNDAFTVTAVGCRCRGTCTAGAAISFEDRAGNAVTHGGNITCSTGTGATTFTAATAGNTFTAGEGIAFDVDTAGNPDAADAYTICFEWEYTDD